MPEEPFSVAFSGPAVANGSMRVDDLMESLLALFEVMQQIQELIYPDSFPKLTLSVGGIRAERDGPFTIDLLLATDSPVVDLKRLIKSFLEMIDTITGRALEATPEEGRRMLDNAARKYLNMSREEFLDAWDMGEISNDTLAVAQVAALIPFGR